MEAAALASLGYTGALNDAWDKYIKALGGFGISAKADYLSSTFYGNPVPFLFKASEPGAWYDPSDLTTLFQDSAGVTPVTAPAQTVGLVLDKSQGLTLGSELWSDAGVTIGTGWTVVSGVYTHTAGTDTIRKSIGLVTGKTYQVTFTVSGRTTGSIGPVYGGTVNGPTVTANGTYTQRVASGTNALLYFQPSIDFVGSVSGISVKLLAGNHATQATLAQRPTYQIDSTGRPYLSFDGVDDGMVTSTITPATDKVQVFAGVRKLSDANRGLLAELSATPNLNSFTLFAPNALTTEYAWTSRGSASATITSPTTYPSPITNILTAIGDIAAPVATLRINGAQVATSAATQGTGNYLAYPLYIGRRGGTTLPFNGRLYSLIVRFGASLTTGQITSTEKWVNSKTGAF
jgi:hypothetical protein